MSRSNRSKRFVLRINLKSGPDIRRFCEVHVDENDNVYVFQPRKGRSVKISYHESGQKHLKVGTGPAMFVMQLDRPEWIRADENVWSKSFENFTDLLLFKGDDADALYDIDLPPLPYSNKIIFAQVSVGRFFDTKEWTMDDVTQSTLRQQIFPVPISPSNVSLCVRVLQLESA